MTQPLEVWALGADELAELREERRKLAARVAEIDRTLAVYLDPDPGPAPGTMLRKIVEYVAAHPGLTARDVSIGVLGKPDARVTCAMANLATARRVLRRSRVRSALTGGNVWHYWTPGAP